MRKALWMMGLWMGTVAWGSCVTEPPSADRSEPSDGPAVGQVQRAYGEPVAGFPSWYERMIHVLTNRSRADPPADLASCTSCADSGCFTSALPPLEWHEDLNHAARFHAANLTHTGCSMSHTSPCTLVSNIGSLYPSSCDGQASCACQGGVSCGGGTDTFSRFGLFGVSGGARAENIAWLGDPFSVYYAWFHEPTSDPTCSWTMANGHRHNILGSFDKLGVGGQGGFTVQDFWNTGSLSQPIPAGAHYPETGTSIDFRANWYDTAGPSQALVNVEGTCYAMTQERGMTAANATYLYEASGLASGCKRYYFIFEDSASQPVYYPDTGSFGIGCATEWSSTRPAEGSGCSCTPDCAGKVCGPDGCGGSCGSCAANESCQSGQCVCNPDCAGKVCGPDGCGGSCGSCAANESCQSGQCVCNPDCAGKVCGPDGCGGSCGSCAANESCQSGQCVCNPDCSSKVCGPDGCGGSCGSCTGGQVCQAGQCVASCSAGLTLCSGVCVDLQTDPAHCGGCDSPCSAGEDCQGGICVSVTPDGGLPDGGLTDGGVADGGVADGGVAEDGSPSDATVTTDASPTADASTASDAATPDAGRNQDPVAGGCHCFTGDADAGPGSGTIPSPFSLGLLLLGWWLWRRRCRVPADQEGYEGYGGYEG